MGHVFECDDEIVWDPTNRVGEAYVGMLRALADVFKTPTGITSRASDWHMIDRDEFGRMVHILLAARGGNQSRLPVPDDGRSPADLHRPL